MIFHVEWTAIVIFFRTGYSNAIISGLLRSINNPYSIIRNYVSVILSKFNPVKSNLVRVDPLLHSIIAKRQICCFDAIPICARVSIFISACIILHTLTNHGFKSFIGKSVLSKCSNEQAHYQKAGNEFFHFSHTFLSLLSLFFILINLNPHYCKKRLISIQP